MTMSPRDLMRQRMLGARFGYGGQNLEIGLSRLPVFREPSVSTRTAERLEPGSIYPLLETRDIGSDRWHKIQLARGPAWVVGRSDGATYAFPTSEAPRQMPKGTKSVNGWPVLPKADASTRVARKIEGVDTPLYAAPAAADALAEMVQWWHENVGRVQILHSYNHRALTGKPHLWSNHASGTAIDINGCWRKSDGSLPKGCLHPYGEETIAEPTKSAIQAKARELGLKWGGDYKGVPLDEMHFEIAMDPASFQAFWAKRRGGGLHRERIFTRARDTVTSMMPGSHIPTRDARTISAIVPNLGTMAGAMVAVGAAIWLLARRPRPVTRPSSRPDWR